MKDFIENMEDAAENRFVEMTKDCPPGKYRCSCGNITDLNDVHFVGPDPWADPICGKCIDEWMKQQEFK